MNRCLAVILLIAFLLPAAAAERDELEAVLEEANGLFREANDLSMTDPGTAHTLYQRAALRYERIIREGGVRNGRLFYNAGNAWFRADDLGRAILNYRRAALYIPGDPNLRQNLAFARSNRLNRFEQKQETRVLETLLFWHYDVPTGARSILFAIFSGVFWIVAALRLRRPQWAPGVLLLVTGLIAGLLLGSLVVEAASGRGSDEGVILAQQVTARKGDGESYEPSFKEPLHSGTEFELVESRPGWHHIELADGRQCWIPEDAAALLTEI